MRSVQIAPDARVNEPERHVPQARLTLLDSSGNDHEKPHFQCVFIVENELGRLRDGSAEQSRERAKAESRLLEILETRQLLATIVWNTTAAPNGGDWDTPGNWVQNKVPGPNDTAKISGLTSPGIVSLNSVPLIPFCQ